MSGTFTETAQGDAMTEVQAATLAAQQRGIAPINGVAERFLHASETRKNYVTGHEALKEYHEKGTPEASQIAEQLQNLITKTVGIGDISAVRLVSLSTDVTKLDNTDTTFLNLIEGRRRNTVTDFTHGFREDTFDADTLDNMVFDPNGAPPSQQHTSARRTNTLTAIGGQVSVGIVTEEMVKKAGFMSELDRQVSDTLLKMKRSWNRQMLQATENAAGPVFKLGGMITRTTANVVTPGGGAATVTQASIDLVIAGIINAVGTRNLAMLATPNAIKFIAGLLATLFPGGRVSDWYVNNDPMRRIATIYYSELVGPIPVYLETQLPSGVLSVFSPELIIPNGFTIGGMAGPWVISLAQTGLAQPKAIFDLQTLEDRNLNARGKVTNIL